MRSFRLDTYRLLSSLRDYLLVVYKNIRKRLSIFLRKGRNYLEIQKLKVEEETKFLKYTKTRPPVKEEMVHIVRGERLLGIITGVAITLLIVGIVWCSYVDFDLIAGLFLGGSIGGIVGVYFGIKLVKERYKLE